MKHSRKFIAGIILAAGLIVFFSGCYRGGAAQSGSAGKEVSSSLLDTITQRGVLKVGLSTFVPWAMKDKNGDLAGFEVDVAKRVARDMGVDIEFIPTKWSGIIPALLTGKFDVIIGGMGIRPDRNLKVNFSIPYEYSGLSLVASREKAPGFNSLEDFNKKDVIIAARLGSTGVEAVKKQIPNAALRLFDDEAKLIQELLTGRVSAVVASSPMPAFQALKYSDKLYLPLKENFTREPIGFALRKGDVDILNFFNSWIRVVDSEGWLKERQHYWFETRDWAGMLQ
ncbi:MAG: amino acid ABC transporter substrate-binding protein [Spirochaetes bacterium]|nr:MAG: amino acid ABC transporter substrate-binding protein [Spirochaetota bacterium]